MRSYDEVRGALDPYVGVPFTELADGFGIAWEADARRRKALGGDLVEHLLGLARNSIPQADLDRLGTEVKSLPLDQRSRPRERTKVTSLNYAEVGAERDFHTSRVLHKFRTTLFVPIQKTDNTDPGYWYLRRPFLWLPSLDQLRVLETDYGTIASAIRARDWDRLHGAPGRFLTVGTAGAKSKGVPEPKTRAWYLKKALTRQICEQHLWPRPERRTGQLDLELT